ncbi:MAG TPA: hypothetical protein VK654_16495 [Nitrospirota bacterium]|nr:hypothetical protein [Nitrospirota bacterium]
MNIHVNANTYEKSLGAKVTSGALHRNASGPAGAAAPRHRTYFREFLCAAIIVFATNAFGADLAVYPGLLNLHAYGSGFSTAGASPVPEATPARRLATLATLQLADVLQTLQFLAVTETRHYSVLSSSTTVVNLGNVLEDGRVDDSRFNGNNSCSVDGSGNAFCLEKTWRFSQRSYTTHKYYETNPLLGERPDALRLVGFSVISFGAVAALTHYLPPRWSSIVSESIVSSMAMNVEGNTALINPCMITSWKRGPIPIVISSRW